MYCKVIQKGEASRWMGSAQLCEVIILAKRLCLGVDPRRSRDNQSRIGKTKSWAVEVREVDFRRAACVSNGRHRCSLIIMLV